MRPIETTPSDVSRLIDAVRDGDADAIDRLMPLIYDDLRRIARRLLAGGPRGVTLQTTAVVHEAVLRLVQPGAAGWENRSHFFGIAAKAMRSVLVDHARERSAAKRGGNREHVYLHEAMAVLDERKIDVLAVDEALTRLAEFDDRKARLVELRFFAGLDAADAANCLGVSVPTVERDWRLAKAWLRRELG